MVNWVYHTQRFQLLKYICNVGIDENSKYDNKIMCLKRIVLKKI